MTLIQGCTESDRVDVLSYANQELSIALIFSAKIPEDFKMDCQLVQSINVVVNTQVNCWTQSAKVQKCKNRL